MARDAVSAVAALPGLAQILDRQQRFFSTHVTKDPAFRRQALQKLQRVVERNEERISRCLYDDLRKSPFEAYSSEIGLVKSEIRLHLRHLEAWTRPERVRTPLHLAGQGRIYREPYGVVLIFAPWTYPFNLSFMPLVGAISAGNCAVLKTPSYAPRNASLIAELIGGEFPAEYLAALQGGREANQALLGERFDYIFYTGNAAFARTVMEAASRHLTPVSLELGGKSPCIVDRGARLELAARRIAWGKFLNAGQTCIAPDYLLVDREVKAELLGLLRAWITRFFGEDPRASPDYPRIVNEKHFDRLLGLLESGVAVCGGQADRGQRYIAPTILDQVSPEDPVMQEEVFGPLLPVLEYERLEQAIAFVNQRPRPLALYFFSEDRRRQRLVLAQTSSGGACLNDAVLQFAHPLLPFGGVGYSGIGAYHGRASFETFSHRRSVLRKSALPDLGMRYPPYAGKLARVRLVLR